MWMPFMVQYCFRWTWFRIGYEHFITQFCLWIFSIDAQKINQFMSVSTWWIVYNGRFHFIFIHFNDNGNGFRIWLNLDRGCVNVCRLSTSNEESKKEKESEILSTRITCIRWFVVFIRIEKKMIKINRKLIDGTEPSTNHFKLRWQRNHFDLHFSPFEWDSSIVEKILRGLHN